MVDVSLTLDKLRKVIGLGEEYQFLTRKKNEIEKEKDHVADSIAFKKKLDEIKIRV